IIIDSLGEGRHTFSIFTIDRGGNFSMELDTIAMIYGPQYERNLINRGIVDANIVGNHPRIFWYDIVDSNMVGVIVKFKKQDSKDTLFVVSNDVNKTVLNEEPLGDSIQISTIYAPDSLSL